MTKSIDWRDTETANFNVIKDGKPVDGPTVNTTIGNITTNLEYLYAHVRNLEVDKGAVVAYDTDVLAGEAHLMLPGTPVYWVPPDSGNIGHWGIARVALRDATSDENPDYYWTYADSALVQGVILRNHVGKNKVDVCLSGKVTFNVTQDDGGTWWVSDQASDSPAKQLLSLFNHHGSNGDTTLPSAFTTEPDTDSNTLNFKSGMFYLSEIDGGKLVPRSQYTRIVALMILESTPGASGYTLNTLVCPEGFGGEKFHIHKSILLGSALGAVYNDQALPDSWYPRVEGGVRYLNSAVGEIDTQNVVYPYSELVGATGASCSEDAKSLYTSGPSAATAAWLSADDPYFTSTGVGCIASQIDAHGGIPTDAVWGFTIGKLSEFTPKVSTSDEVWQVPVDPGHILLTRDGQLIPNSHYKITNSGIWWLAKGVENAPISIVFGDAYGSATTQNASREIHMLYIDALGESGGGPVNQVESDELIAVKSTTGIAKIESKETYLSQPMIPVLPFNPMDDLERATEDEVEAIETEKIMTPHTTHHALEHFVALTEMDSQRSCQEYVGNWDGLRKSGFYKIIGATDGPKDSEESAPLGLVGAHGNQIFQFELGKFASFVRVGSGGTTVWGAWLLITEKPYDPLYLPVSQDNKLLTENLDLEKHRERTIVSLDESTNLVVLPKLTGYGYEDGLRIRFMNEASQGSVASTLVIKLISGVSGYDGKYLVCPAQQCEPARHHMGQEMYIAEANNDVSNIPDYLDAQVTAEFASAGTLNFDDSEPATSNSRYVKVECEAPQYYGNNTISLEVIDGAWAITGGYGIWFILGDAEYDSMVSGNSISGCLDNLLGESRLGEEKIQNNLKTALKFTSKQVRTPVFNYSVPSWGRQLFSASGTITSGSTWYNNTGNWWVPFSLRQIPTV